MHNVRLRLGVGAACVLVLIVLVAAVVSASLRGAPGVQRIPVAPAEGHAGGPPTAAGSSPTPSPSTAAILVHVTGAVRTPGVYAIRPGSRVLDAVAAASGFADDADRERVNLVRELADGEQLVLPRVGDAVGATQPGGGSAGAVGGGMLDLNRATASELESLPRVGPQLAQRIVEYRERNGPFRSVDELLGVSGIGERTIEDLRARISV